MELVSQTPEYSQEEIQKGISEAIELSQMTMQEVSLDPITLGIGDVSIDDLNVPGKAVFAKTIWDVFGLRKGSDFKSSILNEFEVPPTEGGRVPGNIRERVFRTRTDECVVHELTFSDGQKRFTVGPTTN